MPSIAEPKTQAKCGRCFVPLQVKPKPGSKAQMLRLAKAPKGYCINCAVHDWIRHTYPINMQIEANPKLLLVPHIQQMYAEIMRHQRADAMPDEINWEWIVEHWDWPFDKPTKRTNTNPCNDADIKRDAAWYRDLERRAKRQKPDPLGGKMTIDSFEDLNKLEPGLGDDLKMALERTTERPPDPPEQKTLF
jgi:hypothetical protein